MIFFDGTYRLRGPVSPLSQISNNPAYSWQVRIIDFSISQPDIKHIRPFAVIINPTDNCIFKTNCAETMGKEVCRDFNLDINKVLWVEYFGDKPGEAYVAIFKPKFYSRAELFYHISWRPIQPHERKAIGSFLPEDDWISHHK